MSEDYELIEQRVISGSGVLKIPQSSKKIRHAYLIADLIRPPRNAYINKNWNPDRGKYAFITFRKDGYVVDTASMEFEKQRWDTIADISGQNLNAIKCAYDGTLKSFANLGAALGAIPVSIQDLIQDFEYLSLNWDEVLVRCYADTAVQLRFYALKHESCDPDRDKQKPPPPPPPPLPRRPPGTPIEDISEPYDSNTSDDNNTNPYPEDSFPPPEPPPIPSCTTVLVTLRVQQQNSPPRIVEGISNERGLQYAPITEARVAGEPGNSYVVVIGGHALGTYACDGRGDREVRYTTASFNPNFPYISAEIISIEPQ